MLVVGVDLGATRLRAALSDGKKFLERIDERTQKNSPKDPSNQIISIIARLCERSGIRHQKLDGICVASAGPLDLNRGELRDPPNFPFERIPIVKPLEEEFGIPVLLMNDCTVAAIGEREFGAGRRVEDLVYVGMGTGIGGGAYVDGHLLEGKDGNAVEIGHLTVDPTGSLRCGCGKKGHWEAYCSGAGIPKFVKWRIREGRETKSKLFELGGKNLSKLDAKLLFECARRGDRLSLELVRELGKFNGIGFTDLVEIFDPSLMTVGGSIALRNSKLILPFIRKWVRAHAYNKTPTIILTPLGVDVGLYGTIRAFNVKGGWR